MLAPPSTHHMRQPNRVLLEAAARLFAHGHNDLAQDLRQLARMYTPTDEQEVCGRSQGSDEEGEAA